MGSKQNEAKFTAGQTVYVEYGNCGGSLVGSRLSVEKIDQGEWVGRGAARLRLADRILCSDGKWYYPDYLSASPTVTDAEAAR